MTIKTPFIGKRDWDVDWLQNFKLTNKCTENKRKLVLHTKIMKPKNQAVIFTPLIN